ncbi:MAG: ABC transporter ATP-binding protein [Promethearchaeota archaeon]
MLELNNVCIKYGDIQVINNISLNIKEGEIVCLLGSNGAGKSTILKAISGIKEIFSGYMKFEDENIANLQSYNIFAKRIVQIPEEKLLFNNMSILENLELGAYIYKDSLENKRRLDMVFELFPILEVRKKQMAGLLSGGEQQMLAIGRGLMGRPKILMLDEPSLGLAPKIQDIVFQTLKNINKRGVTIFLVEQNANRAISISSRGYVLEDGNIIFEGPRKDLLQNKKVKEAYLKI